MPVKAAIFDYDGTSLDSWAQATVVIRAMMEEFGCPYSDAKMVRIRKNWGHIASEAFKEVCPAVDPEILRLFWVQGLQEENDRETVEMIRGADDMFATLRAQGIVRALLTNRKAKHLAGNIPPSLDLIGAFDIVQTLQDTKRGESVFFDHPAHLVAVHPKPQKEALAPTLEVLQKRYGIAHDEIVSVGDTIVDLKTAAANDLRFVGVLTGAVNTKIRWLRCAKENGISIDLDNILRAIAYMPDWIAKYG